MNALSSPTDVDGLNDTAATEYANEALGGLALALQFSRATALSLARLQLALKSGDRQCALEVMDRLHALDNEMERLVERLPRGLGNDQEWGAIEKHLSDQKLAIAFEKLVLVSEVSGPGVVSPPTPLTPEALELPESLTSQADVDYHAEEERQPVPMGTIIGFLLALLTMAAMAGAAMIFSSL